MARGRHNKKAASLVTPRGRSQHRYNNSPKGKRNIRAAQRRLQYGLSEEDWTTLVLAACGRCGICGQMDDDTPLRTLCADHDHLTDKVRGLVCDQCNRGLHWLDNTEWLKRAVQYLRGGQ